MSNEAPIAPPPQARVARKQRTPRLIAIMISVMAGAWAGWQWWHTHQESTDDAQVEGHIINIAPRVAGEVIKVAVTDNQLVAAGDVLFALDDEEYKARVAAATADLAAAHAGAEASRAVLAMTERTAPAGLAQAQGGLASAVSSARSARAAVEQSRAEIAAAEARRNLAQITFDRTRRLVDQNAIPRAELDTQSSQLEAAIAAVAEAKARAASAEAAVAGSTGGVTFATGRLDAAQTTEQQFASARAAVQLADARRSQAEAALHLAELSLRYTVVRAPHAGVVSRRMVEVGQTVAPDRPLLAIVPQDDLWVIANFKEDQVAEIRPGQRVDLRFDAFGRRDFSGKVDSIAGATGARFALIPPDNATGNFVKVVQRIPVLIRLTCPCGVEFRPGMSAEVTVHTDSP